MLEKITNRILIPEDVAANLDNVRDGNQVGKRIKLSKYFSIAKKFYNKQRRHNPIAPNQADIVNWILWDRITCAAAGTFAAGYNFFTTPIGQASKTKIDTNMEQVMRLPDPQWFNATNIGFSFNTNIAKADLDNVLSSYYMEFWVGQKVYEEGPVFQFPSGTGVTGYAATTATTTTVQGQNNGFPAISNVYDMRLPQGINLGMGDDGGIKVTDGLTGINILQGQSFKVALAGTSFTAAASGATFGTGITMYCMLQGILSRGVQ